MTTTLTPVQAGITERARKSLDEPCGHGTHSLAVRVGTLEHYLREMLALVDQLSASADGHFPG